MKIYKIQMEVIVEDEYYDTDDELLSAIEKRIGSLGGILSNEILTIDEVED